MAPTNAQAKEKSPASKQGQYLNGSTHKSIAEKPKDYRSHGVSDHDIFVLPRSDFQLLGLLTAVAAIVRLFRIYQPSSVVFDEVQ